MSTKAKGYAKIDNEIYLNPNISGPACKVYLIVKHYSTIPGFKIIREKIKAFSGFGETMFRRAWKELKELGLLLESKIVVNGRYEWRYKLKGQEVNKKKEKVAALVEGKENLYAADDIQAVKNITNLSEEQCAELLKIAKGDIKKIEESYRYTSNKSGVKSLYGYLKWVIKHLDLCNTVSSSINKIKSTFNNFSQRTYDFVKLENAIHYGEAYELPH